ncbi:MAG: porin family protein [Treponema sp.]|jgi:hypothetical protein|nr:porin family protein [Treponema sp.]
MNKKLVLCFILVLAALSLSALEFSLRPGGFVFFPAGQGNEAADGNKRFDIGGGGQLGFDVDFASIWPNPLGLGYTAGIEGGLLYNPYKSPASGDVQNYSFGGALGLYYFSLSRLFTRIDGGIGVYQSVIEEGRGRPGLWWRAGGGAGFRFTPVFTLAANGGWRQYQSGNGGGVFNSGFYTGLILQITFEAGKSSRDEGTGVVFVQDDGVYPALLSLYQQNPAGTIVIRNNENAEIRDLRASFRAGDYTASEFPCGKVPLIAKGRSAALPLYADFSPEVLRFTDTGRILGEVVIRYRLLGKEKQSVRTVAVQVHNRNVFAALAPLAQGEGNRGEGRKVKDADWAKLAAFVPPAAPGILEYAKHITGLARVNRRTGLNQNMQFAVWLFEGLRIAGIRLREEDAPAPAPRDGGGWAAGGGAVSGGDLGVQDGEPGGHRPALCGGAGGVGDPLRPCSPGKRFRRRVPSG